MDVYYGYVLTLKAPVANAADGIWSKHGILIYSAWQGLTVGQADFSPSVLLNPGSSYILPGYTQPSLYQHSIQRQNLL